MTIRGTGKLLQFIANQRLVKPCPSILKELIEIIFTMTKFTTTGNGSEAWIFALTEHGNIYAIGLPWGGWTPNWPNSFPGPNSVVDIIALDALGPKLFAIDSNHEYWAIGIPGGGWTKNWGGDLNFQAKSFLGGHCGFLVIEAVDGSYYVNGNLGNGGSWVKADNITPPF